MYEKFGQFIDGNWSPSSNKETYEVINPATEEVLGHASKATPADVDRALKSAEKGLKDWKKITPWNRSYILRRIADKLREKKDVLAKWMTLENGKPLVEGIGETNGAADIFEWNAEETKRILVKLSKVDLKTQEYTFIISLSELLLHYHLGIFHLF